MFALHALQTGTGEAHLPPAWQALARCSNGTGSMLELFFSEQIDDINSAKAFCLECPVREPCLEGAVARREPWACGVGSSSSTGRCSRRSASGAGHPRCVRRSCPGCLVGRHRCPTAQTA